ncbi:MAG: hypothetical protein AAF366_00845 [Pseudomonadota bacterium]
MIRVAATLPKDAPMFLRDMTDPLIRLMEADSIDTLWPAAVALVETAGYAALSLVEVSPKDGPLWAKSSMSEMWLYTYATQGFHAIDPLLLGAMSGQREMCLQSGALWPGGPANEKAEAMERALIDTGYGQFDAMAFDKRRHGTRLLVVLASHVAATGPESPPLRASRQLLTSTLAAGLNKVSAKDDDGFL